MKSMQPMTGLRALSLGAIATFGVLGASCAESHGNVGLRVRFDPAALADEVALVELSLVDSCFGITLGNAIPGAKSWTVQRDSQGSPGGVAPGKYAVYGRAIDEDCRVIAAGCIPFEVSASKPAEVELTLGTHAIDPVVRSACGLGYACEATCGDAAVEGAVDGAADVPDAGPECAEDDDCGATDWCDPTGKCADSTECDDDDSALLFCDGFEGPALAAGWTRDGSRDVVLDSATKYRGRSSAHSTALTASENAFISREVGPVTSGSFYLRAHFFVERAMREQYDLIKLFDPAGDDYLSLIVVDGQLTFWNAQAVSGQVAGTVALPTGEWVCVRWAVGVGSGATVNLAVGDEQIEWDNVDALPGGVGRVQLPVPPGAPRSGDLDVYVDELALSTSPLSCD